MPKVPWAHGPTCRRAQGPLGLPMRNPPMGATAWPDAAPSCSQCQEFTLLNKLVLPLPMTQNVFVCGQDQITRTSHLANACKGEHPFKIPSSYSGW